MRKMFGRLIGEKIGEYISNVRGDAFDRLSMNATSEFSIRIRSFRKKCIDKETVGNLSGETLAMQLYIFISEYRGFAGKEESLIVELFR